MNMYPVTLKLDKKKVVIIGAGKVAGRKLAAIVECGAEVMVVAKSVSDEFTRVAADMDVEIIGSEYDSEVLSGAFLAIAATDDNELNRRIYSDCRERKILCNVVDVPEICDFYVPAVVQQGDIQIAVSTAGKCPAYASALKKQLQEQFTEDHAKFLNVLADIRGKLISAGGRDAKLRKKIMQVLTSQQSFENFMAHDVDSWHQWAQDIISEYTAG